MKREKSGEDIKDNQKMIKKEWILIAFIAEKTGVIVEGPTTSWAGRKPKPWWDTNREEERSSELCLK